MAVFQLLIVAGFLTAVWFSFGQNVLVPRTQSGVPDRLGAMKLVSVIEGSEALAQVNRLHGTTINLQTAYIAEYARDNQRATVWLGIAESSTAAADLLRRMAEGIARGGSSFSNLTKLTIPIGYHSHEVFQIEGSGGKHFFYQSRAVGERVVWLTVEGVDAMPILEEAIKTF